MIDTSWLTDNWPWWLMVFFLVVYEFYALATGKRTLSRMVWTSSVKYPHMVPIALSFVAWLVIHFWVTLGDWATELLWTGVLVGVIWLVYFTVRKRESNGDG